MGLYDSVMFSCPKCHEKVYVQSKAGECLLQTFLSATVPVEVASDILDQTFYCVCGAHLVIKSDDAIVRTISMKVDVV